MPNKTVKLKDGIIKQNVVLMSGLFAGPVIGAATTWERSLALCFVFSLVTVLSVGLCRLLPKKITFAVRIVLYALISAVVYIPVMLLAGLIFPSEVTDSIALYLILSVTNPLIMSKTESRFFLRPHLMMYKDVLSFVLGFDLSCILVGSIRDIFTD
ncbi:MAG: NADH:ubiquinone oxidoreductase subunit RnfE, partial [Ruminiclostridium sp.]|nr:NADH:ubiquinone oxidoreductase subunit RnfE [Ruminiclostridium sp.]